jgi:hypothetical protein
MSSFESFKEQIRADWALQRAVLEMSNICWNICVKSPNSSSLDSHTKECLDNCVRMMFDSSTFIRLEFAKKLRIKEQNEEKKKHYTYSNNNNKK